MQHECSTNKARISLDECSSHLVDVPVLLLVQLFQYVRFVEALDYVGRYEFDGNNMSVLDVGC